MTRTALIFLVVLSLMACKEKKKYFMEIEGAEAGIVEGDIHQVHLYHGDYDKELLEGAKILSTDPSIVSTRQTPEDWKKSIRGFYLLAHRPGTVNLGAVRKGKEVATIEVTVREQ